MKNKTRHASIIFSCCFMLQMLFIPVGFSASSSAFSEQISAAKMEAKDRINQYIYDFSVNVLNSFTNSLGFTPKSNGETMTKGAYQSKNPILQGKKIAIDPGHGGKNPGATAYGMRETDNNLAVSLKVKKLLEERGAQVIMTRTADSAVAKAGETLRNELQARVDIAHRSNADIFVSIHTNSNENPAIHGAMTFFYDENSKRLAEAAQNHMVLASGAADKGTDIGNFLVLRNNSVPAILVEMGFISNEQEALKLNQDAYRDAIALGIADGIEAYFKNEK